MIRRDESLIVNVVTQTMVPMIQVFALYVIFHGHYSPGGGFQGGALLAGSVLLQRIVLGRRRSQPGFPGGYATVVGVVGFLVFFGTGLLATAFGGSFLQYDALPLPLDAVMRRNAGILFVELGVALVVMSTLISIFDTLMEGNER